MRGCECSLTREELEGKIKLAYEKDVSNFDDYVNSKKTNFDTNSFLRLVRSELSYKNILPQNTICGFSREKILEMASRPERYGKQIVKLSEFMYLKSGYYRKLVDYLSEVGMIRWFTETEVYGMEYFTTDKTEIRKNYIDYSAFCNRYKLDNEFPRIAKKMYLDDAVFGFVVENGVSNHIEFLDPTICTITGTADGLYLYSIEVSCVNREKFKALPLELQILVQEAKSGNLKRLEIPFDKSFCLKFNEEFEYIYPPFISVIIDILCIEDYKGLARAKSEGDAYKLLSMKIPTDKSGKIVMNDKDSEPFIEMARDILPEYFGLIPTPMDVQAIEFNGTSTADRDKVTDATTWMYSNAGFSSSILGTGSKSAELKYSIAIDSSSIYRIYRQIEKYVNLQCWLRGKTYKGYGFVYKILDITIFNASDVFNEELKSAQSSIQNKFRLGASKGINPLALIASARMETEIFADVFDSWKPLSSSYTQSGDNEDAGGQTVNDEDLTESGEANRDNGTNDSDNRV